MHSSTAKHIGEIAGVGLAANYMKNVQEGRAQHPDMEGGLNPRLAPTGDRAHDATMEAGRLAANVGVSWFILLPVWKFYAFATWLGLMFVINPLPLALHLIVWGALQLLFLVTCSRLFDGKRVKDPAPAPIPPPRPHMSMTFINNWGEPIPVAFHHEMGWIDAWGRTFSVHNQAL